MGLEGFVWFCVVLGGAYSSVGVVEVWLTRGNMGVAAVDEY